MRRFKGLSQALVLDRSTRDTYLTMAYTSVTPVEQPHMTPTFSLSRRIAQAGYSLVELAVVMLIVALLIGGLLLPLSAQQEVRNRADTERTLSEIQAALIGYAMVNGRLPRPATSATDGTESATPCTTDALCSGFIPWSALSITKIDGWGKLLRYSVTPAYAGGATGSTLIALTSVANRTVQTRDSAGTTSYLAGRAVCSAADQCVAAVIFSHGKERLGTLDGGTATPSSSITNLDEIANDTGPTSYFSRSPNDDTGTTGGEFDDIVTWVSTYTIVNKLVAVGKLP
jgi:prepilin-type N-terminal cleavage/methylation domain-containing protein